MPMEGGQESNIPLDAPIEIESESTVVPISSPTFLQKFADKYNNLLSNSIKYEDDGWFVGWDRLIIKLEVNNDDETSPGIVLDPNDFEVASILKNSLSRGETVLKFYFSNGLRFQLWFKITNPDVTFEPFNYDDDPPILKATFRSNVDGMSPMEMEFNANTLKLISWKPSAPADVDDFENRYELFQDVIQMYFQTKNKKKDYFNYIRPAFKMLWHDKVDPNDNSGKDIPVTKYGDGSYKKDGDEHTFNGVYKTDGSSGNGEAIGALDMVKRPLVDPFKPTMILTRTGELTFMMTLKKVTIDIKWGVVTVGDDIDIQKEIQKYVKILSTNRVSLTQGYPKIEFEAELSGITITGRGTVTINMSRVGVTHYISNPSGDPNDPDIEVWDGWNYTFSPNFALSAAIQNHPGISKSMTPTSSNWNAARPGSLQIKVGNFTFNVAISGFNNAQTAGMPTLGAATVSGGNGTATKGTGNMYKLEELAITPTPSETKTTQFKVEYLLYADRVQVSAEPATIIDGYSVNGAGQGSSRLALVIGLKDMKLNAQYDSFQLNVAFSRDERQQVDIITGSASGEFLGLPFTIADTEKYDINALPLPDDTTPPPNNMGHEDDLTPEFIDRQYHMVVITMSNGEKLFWGYQKPNNGFKKAMLPVWQSTSEDLVANTNPKVLSDDLEHAIQFVNSITRQIRVKCEFTPFEVVDRYGNITSAFNVAKIDGNYGAMDMITEHPELYISYFPNSRFSWIHTDPNNTYGYVIDSGKREFEDPGDPTATPPVPPSGPIDPPQVVYLFEGVSDSVSIFAEKAFKWNHQSHGFKYLSHDIVDGNYVVKFEYDEEEYTLKVPLTLSYQYVWRSRDIRKPRIPANDIILRTTEKGEYIVNQSHWNGDTQRDVWVVDNNTLIVLSFQDKVSLYKKCYDAPEDELEAEQEEVDLCKETLKTAKEAYKADPSDANKAIVEAAKAALEAELKIQSILVDFGYSSDWITPKGTPRPAVHQAYEWREADYTKWSKWDMRIRYGISNATDALPFIWSFDWFYNSPAEAGLTIRYFEAPITVEQFRHPVWDTVNVIVENADLDLSTDQINIQAPYMTPEEIWNLCRLSATRVNKNDDGELWFGIQVDKCLKQWIIQIPASVGNINIINGFGFVGLDGTLTGGQYPTDFVYTDKGFDALVMDLTKPAAPSKPDMYEETLTNAEKVLDYDAMYDSGTLYFTRAFDNLCVAMEGNGKGGLRKINIPFYQEHKMDMKHDDNRRDSLSPKAFHVVAIKSMTAAAAEIGTASAAFVEAVSCTWKTQNDIQSNDMKFKINVRAKRELNSGNAYYVACIGAGLAGAVNASMQAPTSLNGLGSAVEASVRDEMKRQDELTGRVSTDTGQQNVWLLLSDFYNIGQQSSIHAGPGFVQTQLAKSASLCSSGLASARYVEEGVGVDVLQFIFIPGLQFGLANGIPSWFHLFGPPTLQAYDTGLTTGTLGKMLAYRKYGYAHRYLNYPTQDIHEHSLTDWWVDMDQISETVEAGNIDVKAIYFESVAEADTQVVKERISIITGSEMPETCIEAAKKSEKSNDNLQFSAPFIYDYCVDVPHELFYSAVDGEIVYVSIKDTKILDGAPSNVVFSGNKTLIGSCYVALEIDHPDDYDVMRLRPRAITPQTLLINQTGINCIHGNRTYHACDAYSNRITKGAGVTGLDIELQNSIYTYRADDDFKISSIFPPMSVFGKFSSSLAITYPWLIECMTEPTFYKSLKSAAEVHTNTRYSIPVIYNRLAILPACIKMIAAYRLHVVDGVTSLVTELRTTQPENRRPDALDFPIYGQIYRWNPEYISQLTTEKGVTALKELVATLGLIYVGSTPECAWFYSEAIRSFYKFQPSSIQRVVNADRFKRVHDGTFDFVSQEVVFDPDTPRGHEIVRNRGDKFVGQIYPPNETIGPYEYYSMAGGMVFQGLRRFQVNRFLITDDMVPDIKRNMGRWKRAQGKKISDYWYQKRKYFWKFNFDWKPTDVLTVEGWMLEPFPLATSYLGVDDYTEAKFEWLINFAISDIMLDIYENRYVSVYLAAETMTVGGVVESNVAQIKLHKKMFARQGQYGYYSYKFNANNGLGDSERLYLWTDGPILIRSIKGINAGKTTKRTSTMEEYADTQGMEEV